MDLGSPYPMVTSQITIASSPELGMAVLSHCVNPRSYVRGLPCSLSINISLFSPSLSTIKLYFKY